MRLFEITKLLYNEANKGYKINLSEINGEICFSILIGSNEAHSIALAIEGIQPPRPMTHDIIIDILNSTDVKLDKVEIYKFSNRTFYSRLYLKNFHIGLKKVDCRPSDAIAIALRYCLPIHIKENVLNNIYSYKEISDSTFDSVSEYESQKVSMTNSALIEKLNVAMDKAINNENYEIAAKLRDKIQSLRDSVKDL